MKQSLRWKLTVLFLPLLILMMLPIPAAAEFNPDVCNSVVVVHPCLELDGGVRELGWGTGFFVGNSGEAPKYIITNYHVIQDFIDYGSGELTDVTINGIGYTGRAKIRIHYDSRDYVEGYYVAGDAIKDVAILKLDTPTSKRQALPLCVPDESMIGSKVYAVGYPGLAENIFAASVTAWGNKDATVTSGVISRFFTQQGTGSNTIQLDCTLRFGNSGGPLVTENNAVIGINTWYYEEFSDDDQVNYAVNINEVIPLLNQYGVTYSMSSTGGNTPAPAETEPVAQPKGPSALVIALIAAAVLLTGGIIVVVAVMASRKPAPAAPAPAPQPAPQRKRPVVRSMLGMQASLAGGQILIGRSNSDCALVFQEGTPGISGRHCSLAFDPATSEFILTDMRSTYGTYLQSGQKLTAGVPVRLRPGDSFYLGERTNMLRVELE